MTIIINGMKIDESTSFAYRQNPKRAGSKAHHRYGIYEGATTYAEYVTACEDGDFSKYAKADLRYDTEKGHLSLLDGDGEAMEPNLPVDQSKVEEVVEEVEEDTAEPDDGDADFNEDLEETDPEDIEESEEI